MKATCPDCGKTWTGTRMEHCPVPGCHQTFSGSRSGDRHRTGLHGVSSGPDARRCLTTAELRSYKTPSGDHFWLVNDVWHFGQRRDPLSISGWDPVAHGPALWETS